MARNKKAHTLRNLKLDDVLDSLFTHNGMSSGEEYFPSDSEESLSEDSTSSRRKGGNSQGTRKRRRTKSRHSTKDSRGEKHTHSRETSEGDGHAGENSGEGHAYTHENSEQDLCENRGDRQTGQHSGGANHAEESSGESGRHTGQHTGEGDTLGTIGVVKGKKRCRKTVPEPSSWSSVKRQNQYQAGRAHKNSTGKNMPAKCVRALKDCMSSCKLNCSKKITNTERGKCFLDYYQLNQNRKYDFIAMTTECLTTDRGSSTSRRARTFKYFLNIGGNRIRVCKLFYLGTLAISQKPVYNVHLKKNHLTGTPKSDGRGKHSKTSIDEDTKEKVRAHISSFPVVESHYCRAKTQKQYLESSLNVSKMYDLYISQCSENGETPVKASYYRHIFTTEFNMGFHIPKSDRCDLCEEYNAALKAGLVSPELEKHYKSHVLEKNAMREERQRDRDNKKSLTITFDLENVITCPRAEISSLFYKRKLNMYNLTAHSSITRKGYCAVWTEATAGRSGNDIASAFIKILERVVVDHPDVSHITTWSDSCVPQNRNSIMAFAIANFLSDHPKIQSITMKFSTAGHSSVQEVDNMHSNIERAMSVSEFFSPVSFLRGVLHANRRRPYTVLQLKKCDFKDFQSCCRALKYKLVPFSTVSTLRFTPCPFMIEYATSHKQSVFVEADIRGPKIDTRSGGQANTLFPKPKVSAQEHILPDLKRKDLQSMLKFMPAVDKDYYKMLCHV